MGNSDHSTGIYAHTQWYTYTDPGVDIFREKDVCQIAWRNEGCGLIARRKEGYGLIAWKKEGYALPERKRGRLEGALRSEASWRARI